MVLKRQSSEEEGDGSKFHFQEPKRRYTSSSSGRHGMHGLSAEELAARLEPFLRGVVQDEVQHAIEKFCCSTSGSSVNQIEPSGARTLQLHFQTKLPSTLFTGSRIESEDNIPVRLVLLDSNTGKIVKSGPLSSIKAEVIALDGDFSAEDHDDWSEKDFNSKIVHEREGKRPLVAGDLVVPLIGGVGELGDICFTDNSSWIRCRKFRLGARVQSTLAGVRIKEAKSEPFVVKDHRGESYKKHHPPYLGDEIWRLERIAKEGAFHKRLAAHGISSVQEFLRLYVTDSILLRNILGAGVSNKTWEIIIKHASACVLDDKLYAYRYGEGVELVFNSIFKVVAAAFDGQNYQGLDKLYSCQMRAVEELKQHAYKNLDCWVAVDQTSVFGTPLLLSTLQDLPSGSAGLNIENVNIPVPHQDELQTVRDPEGLTTPQPYMYEPESPMVQNIRSMQVFSPALRNSFIMRDFCYGPYGDGWGAGPSGSPGSIVLTGGLLAADDNSQDEMPFMQGNGFYVAPSSQAGNIISSGFGIPLPKNVKPKARWCKIRAAIKWVSVRRDVAAKKNSTAAFLF